MPKAYITGDITYIENHREVPRFYEAIGEVCSEYGFTPYIAHFDIKPEVDYGHISSLVKNSDVVIAYVGRKSLEVGMELAHAHVAGLPIILLYEEGEHVTRLLRDIPTILAEIQFTDYRGALAKLGSVLQKVARQNELNHSSAPRLGRQWYLSLKDGGDMTVLHIEIFQEPGSTTQKLTVKNGAHVPILITDVPSNDQVVLEQELRQLANRAVEPKTVYIEHFPIDTIAVIKRVVEMVWPDAKIYHEFQ